MKIGILVSVFLFLQGAFKDFLIIAISADVLGYETAKTAIIKLMNMDNGVFGLISWTFVVIRCFDFYYNDKRARKIRGI